MQRKVGDQPWVRINVNRKTLALTGNAGGLARIEREERKLRSMCESLRLRRDADEGVRVPSIKVRSF